MIGNKSGVNPLRRHRSSRKYDVAMYYPVPLTGKWVSHIFLSLATGFAELGARVAVGSSECALGEATNCDRIVLPRILYRAMCKARVPVQSACDLFAYPRMRDSRIAYLWPGTPVWMHRKLRRSGCMVVAEMINCHVGTSFRILEEVYKEEGIPQPASSAKSLRNEIERLELADYAFAPSPPVRQSLLDSGLPDHKILTSTYGFSPVRIGGSRVTPRRDGQFTVLFVGSGIWRKGLHILLRAWKLCGSNCRLLIAGEVSADLAERYKSELNAPSVELLGHIKDVGAIMKQADIFAFPTFEEGSPLVTYEAIAAGLPVVATPMGAGEIIRHEREGLVVEPFSASELAEAIRRLRDDAPFRNKLSENAIQRSSDFTWNKVAQSRFNQLTAAFEEWSDKS